MKLKQFIAFAFNFSQDRGVSFCEGEKVQQLALNKEFKLPKGMISTGAFDVRKAMGQIKNKRKISVCIHSNPAVLVVYDKEMHSFCHQVLSF